MLEGELPPQTITLPKAGITPTTCTCAHEVDLGTAVDRAEGICALMVCPAGGYMSFLQGTQQ